MQTRDEVRRRWHALSAPEKQERLAHLRRRQRQQVLRDARALRLRDA